MAAGTYYTGRYLGGVVGRQPCRRDPRRPGDGRRGLAGFAVLAAVGVAVALVSLGLPGGPMTAGDPVAGTPGTGA